MLEGLPALCCSFIPLKEPTLFLFRPLHRRSFLILILILILIFIIIIIIIVIIFFYFQKKLYYYFFRNDLTRVLKVSKLSKLCTDVLLSRDTSSFVVISTLKTSLEETGPLDSNVLALFNRVQELKVSVLLSFFSW